MGHKVNPRAFRLGTVQTWDATWFAKKNFSATLREDVQIREYLRKELKEALVDRIEFERTRHILNVVVYSAKPGLIIGRAGAGIEDLKKKILKKFFRGDLF